MLRITACALLLTVAACDRGTSKQASPSASAAGVTAPSIFDSDYPFRCSEDDEVGCSGVLGVRAAPADAGDKADGRPSQIAVLKDGQDAFRARIGTLRAARRSVRVQALIFRADESGLRIAELLKAKKKEGLDVRVIVDAASNLDWHTQWMYFDLKQNGVEVEGYEALYLHWVNADLDPRDPLRPNKRFHDKVWVVDAEEPEGAVAIVGGLNLANEYFRVDSTPINRWTDQDVIVRGGLVDDVAAVFDRNYTYFKEIKDKRPGLLDTDNNWKLTRATLDRIAKVQVPDWRRPELDRAIDEVLEKEAKPSYTHATARFLQSRPRMKETYIRQAYRDLLDRADKSIFVANAYFIPPRELIDRLQAAARRGVRVVVLTNSPETNDIRPVALVSRYTYLELLKVNDEAEVKKRAAAGAGIAIHEWAGAPHGEGTLHAKYLVVDGREAIVGSYNLDPRSDKLNSETALAFRSEILASALQETFEQELLPKSVVISRQQAESFRKPKDIDEKFELLFALPLKKWL